MGQVAVVTGASRGIGKATALALANAGFDVAITARTVHEGEGVDDSDRGAGTVPGSLDTTAAAIEATGRRALSVPMDLMDRVDAGRRRRPRAVASGVASTCWSTTRCTPDRAA